MIKQWCEALQRYMTFCQRKNPLRGEFTQGDQPTTRRRRT
jgi:hypothetical protein